jgi:DNA transposition AAA+ family ATPase
MNQTIRERIIQHLKDSSKSQSKFSKELGVSTAMLSQYLSGTYEGNVETIEGKAAEFFELLEKAAAVVKAPGYVETSVSKEVYSLISYCHVNRCMGIIIGHAGVGKSKGAFKYTTDYSEAIFITATKACKSQKVIYKMIARKLHINENRNVSDLELAIREKLDGSNKIIIIDEAQHMPVSAIDGIRCLNDESPETELPPVGIVFIGNFDLWYKMNGKFEQQYDQVRNRFRMKRFFTTEDVKIEDIKRLFPVYAERDMKKEIEFIHGIAQSRWAIRGAMTVFVNASNNGDISLKGLEAIAKYLGIGIAG